MTTPYDGGTTPTEHRSPTMHFRLRRQGAIDLEFDGVLLADQTSQTGDRPRWGEIRIYRTDSGRYVVQEVGRRANETEMERHNVNVVDDAEGIRRVLTKRGTPNDPARQGEIAEYLTNLALDAIDQAAKADPNLVMIESI